MIQSNFCKLKKGLLTTQGERPARAFKKNTFHFVGDLKIDVTECSQFHETSVSVGLEEKILIREKHVGQIILKT